MLFRSAKKCTMIIAPPPASPSHRTKSATATRPPFLSAALTPRPRKRCLDTLRYLPQWISTPTSVPTSLPRPRRKWKKAFEHTSEHSYRFSAENTRFVNSSSLATRTMQSVLIGSEYPVMDTLLFYVENGETPELSLLTRSSRHSSLTLCSVSKIGRAHV